MPNDTSNDTSRGSKSPRTIAAAVIFAALIIIAVVVVASGPKPQPATQESEKTAEKPADTAAAKPEPISIAMLETPRPVPATVFKDAADADQTLANFNGKVLVVNFWATWCAPCVKEMPTLDALEAKLGGPDFQVLTISQDREGAKVAKPFVEKNQWTHLPLYVEAAGKFMKDTRLNGLPTSLIVDKHGNEVARVEGELDWNSPEVEKVLRDLMAKS